MGIRSASVVLAALLVSSGGSTCSKQEGDPKVQKDPGDKAPDVTLEGVDTSALTPREKREWSSYVSELLAPCQNVPVSVAQCVKEKRACDKCLPAAKYVLKGVRDGQTREQIEKSFKNRFDPARIRNVALDGSPSKGPDNAGITIIEFADFECPYCGVMAPILEKAREARPADVRVVYKFMPLAGHPHGEISARAGIAAIQQGKFWEMHKKLFENQQHLEQSDLDIYAREIGLDLAKFHADMQSKDTTERLQKDRKLADSLEVKGTPTLFINGREFDTHQDLGEWLSQELGAAGSRAAAPAASGAPSGSAPAASGAASSLPVASSDAGARK